MWIEVVRGYLSGLFHNGSRRDGVRVFCYHGVVEHKKDRILERNFHLLKNFQAHIHFLRRFRVLNLAELADEVRLPAGWRKPAAIITFDDGYANNLLAGELLTAARLPWSIFVATGSIDREHSIWPVELALLLLHGRAEHVEVLDKVWRLRSRGQREAAFQDIRHPLKSMPTPLRQQVIDDLRQQFPAAETQRLLAEFPSLRMLSWEEVGQLAGAGVEIGSHGVDHELHHTAQLESVQQRELTESKAELEERLRRSCRFFAFPNGDFTPWSAHQVQASGYELAFTTQSGTVRPGANPYLLPRLNPAASLPTFVRNFLWEPASRASEP